MIAAAKHSSSLQIAVGGQQLKTSLYEILDPHQHSFNERQAQEQVEGSQRPQKPQQTPPFLSPAPSSTTPPCSPSNFVSVVTNSEASSSSAPAASASAPISFQAKKTTNHRLQVESGDEAVTRSTPKGPQETGMTFDVEFCLVSKSNAHALSLLFHPFTTKVLHSHFCYCIQMQCWRHFARIMHHMWNAS